MQINFTSKLILDKSFQANLKHSNPKAIEDGARKIVETSGFEKLSGVDKVTLFAKKSHRGDYIVIKYGDEDLDISTRGEVTPWDVLHQLLLYTCIKNEKTPRSAHPKEVIKKIYELIEDFQQNNS